MKALVPRLAAVLLVAAPIALPGPSAAADPILKLDGTLVDNVQRMRGSTASLRVRLDRMSTATESGHFAELFRDRGARALQTALYEDPIGRLEIGNQLGWPIGYAQELNDDKGKHLILLALRPVSFREVFLSTRSRDYLFTAVLIDLEGDRVARAELLPAARIRVLGDGRIDLVNLVEQPMPILGLRDRSS